MTASQSYPYPQVFMVDSGGGQQPSIHPPGLVPCWSFPPAQERLRSRRKGSSGVSFGLALGLLFFLLLIFAALGLGAYQIHKLQTELAVMRQESDQHGAGPVLLKQIGTGPDKEEADTAAPVARPAAHVIAGRARKNKSNPLLWESQTGRAFTAGGVVYRDGGLEVNSTGLYQVYSRVEFLPNQCSITDVQVHHMYLRRPGHPQDILLMEGNWEGYCSSDQAKYSSHKNARTSGSYLSAIMKLQKHDCVYVNLTKPAMLTHHHNANFFGLYKI